MKIIISFIPNLQQNYKQCTVQVFDLFPTSLEWNESKGSWVCE